MQRFFIVLKPQGAPLRVAVLGRKRLPESDRHERIGGFIDMVAKSGTAIESEFKQHRYSTKTRGERTVPAVRPAGEGVYALLQRSRNLHLTYELELPEQSGEVQEELNIPCQGAYILSIKNLEKPAPARRRAFPKRKRRTTRNPCSGSSTAVASPRPIRNCSITKAPSSS